LDRWGASAAKPSRFSAPSCTVNTVAHSSQVQTIVEAVTVFNPGEEVQLLPDQDFRLVFARFERSVRVTSERHPASSVRTTQHEMRDVRSSGVTEEEDSAIRVGRPAD